MAETLPRKFHLPCFLQARPMKCVTGQDLQDLHAFPQVCPEMDEWVDIWMDKWMDGWMDGWIDRWMDGW